MKRISFITLSVLLSIGSFAQHNFKPGSIIKNGEVIQGTIDYKSLNQSSIKCIFKSNSGKITTYTPTEIEGYELTNEKRFVSKNYQSTPLFFEYLVEGRLNLFYVKNLAEERFLIQKEDGDIIELKNTSNEIIEDGRVVSQFSRKEYIGILKMLTQDAPSLRNEIDKTLYNHKSLTALIKKYHEIVCPDEVCLAYERNAQFKFYYGPEFGIAFSSVRTDFSPSYNNALSGREIEGSTSITVGLKLAAKGLFGTNERVCPNLSLLYSNHQYAIEEGNYKAATTANSSFMKLGLIINYELFDNKKWIPYIGAGFAADFFIKNDLIEQTYVANKEFQNTKTQMNLIGATGLKYEIAPSVDLDFSFVYEHGTGIVNPNMGGWRTRTNDIYFRLGILFHKK